MTITPVPARWRVQVPSLGARLVGLFVILAIAVAVTFMLGMHALQRVGWHEYLRPLVTIYTVTGGINEARYPALRGIMQAKNKEVKQVGLQDMGLDGKAGKAARRESGDRPLKARLCRSSEGEEKEISAA